MADTKPPVRLSPAPEEEDDLEPHFRVDAGLPIVRLGLDQHRVLAEVVDVLAGQGENGHAGFPGDPDLFHRDLRLVRVVQADRVLVAATGEPVIRPLTMATASVQHLSKWLRFERWVAKGDTGEFKLCGPPPPLVTALLESGRWPGVRPLVGITEVPFLRPDGTIVQDPGYDERTGYLYTPNAPYPEVCDSPTQADAAYALRQLTDLFADFPHVNEHHRMVPIAAILTMLARPAIAGAIPAFVFDASTRGSGKSLQCDVVAAIASGRSAARLGYPEQEEELEKVLASAAISGTRLLCLDNVTRTFGGGHLDRVLTARDTVLLRPLGQSSLCQLTWNAIILANGNNIVLGGDTSRRVLMCRIESSLENPEARTDIRIKLLVDHVLANRATFVAFALTILRAYTAHGLPDAGLARWGSFEGWSALIPSAIVFAGGADPMGARPTSDVDHDDAYRALATVLRDLPRVSIVPIALRDLIRALYPAGKAPDAPDGFDELRDAFEVLAPPPRVGVAPPTSKLAARLRRFVGRVIGGARLTREEGNKAVQRYVVQRS